MMKMPELLVFAKMFVVGLAAAEVFRATYYLGTAFTPVIAHIGFWVRATVFIVVLAICGMYAFNRGALTSAVLMGRSLRVDLLVAVCLGGWSNELAAPWLSKFHAVLKESNPYWAPLLLLLICTVMLSSIFRRYWPRKTRENFSQLRFLTDDAVKHEGDDLLENKSLAKSFAENVLASDAHKSLVFGVEGPWGIGKTSFVNLAAHYWQASDRVIVCRFEPLRYATEPNLVHRLIRDLSATIQSKVFVPEFQPAASRYSRFIKGKVDISFLGFKLSLDPSQKTVDVLLEDIDGVLSRIGRRAIIVIDDLDRLDPKAVNNVLFATQRTFKLSQVTYVLCYDTEVLVGGKEEGSRAREFLEKYVTVKLSLFVDRRSLSKFLRRDWEFSEIQPGSVPSDTMVKLGAVLNELADLLEGESAANYTPLIGDLRKIKRFINAIHVMQIEKTDLGRMDFNTRDLINLLLLHLNHPGLFRCIYAEETEGRIGTFSVQPNYDERTFQNADDFSQLKDEQQKDAKFLLGQLFDVKVLKLGDPRLIDEAVRRSRACFNSGDTRNLESYLNLIVRFVAPEPQETFKFYQLAVERVREGESIASVFAGSDFLLKQQESVHDQFWNVLVNQAYKFTSEAAEDAIETLVNYLPRYSLFDHDVGDRSLRARSAFSLVRLLDRYGWGGTTGQRRMNSPENVVQIAWRIFGEETFVGKGLLERLANPDRGALGWYDLMLFRLLCSADRGGQLYNLYSALIADQDMKASASHIENNREKTLLGMRKLSQRVFASFKHAYIDAERNFIAEACDVPVEAFLGDAFLHLHQEASRDPGSELGDTTLARRVAATRIAVASFVVFQLSKAVEPNGTGVGCGYYDEFGANDGSGISKLMNDYIFGFCFNPEVNEGNASRFLDHCLSHLSSPFLKGHEDGYIATKEGLLSGFDSKSMGSYWRRHGDHIQKLELQNSGRKVFTTGYTAVYRDDLPNVFAVLDELATDAA